MRVPYRAVAAVLFAILSTVPTLYAGGTKCPPRRGVIKSAKEVDTVMVGMDRGSRKLESEVVFVDSADNQAYFLDKSDAARKCLGQTVTVVAHPMRSNPKVLVVHQIRCPKQQ